MAPRRPRAPQHLQQGRPVLLLNGYASPLHIPNFRMLMWHAGPHVCIAKNLAYQKLRHALARTVLALDIAPARAFRAGIRNMRTNFLARPLRVCVTRR